MVPIFFFSQTQKIKMSITYLGMITTKNYKIYFEG